MIVLWVLIFLTVLASEFNILTRTETLATTNYRQEAEAYYAALAGIEQAKAEILAASGPVYLDETGRLILSSSEKDKAIERQGTVGTATFTYTLVDEDRKLNLNNLADIELRNLFGRLGIEETLLNTLVDSILDWRDPDNLHRINGAEDDYYRSLTPPYSCKDAPFDSVDELLQIKGMKRELLYGASANGGSGRLADLLTTWGSGALNVNTADTLALETKFGPASAAMIVAQRAAGPILTPPVSGGTTQSLVFAVTSTGSSGSMKRTVRAVYAKKTAKEMTLLFWDDFAKER